MQGEILMRKKLFRIIAALFLIISTGCSQEQSKEKVEITQDFIPLTDIEENRSPIKMYCHTKCRKYIFL